MKQSMFLLSAVAALGMAQDSEGSPVKFLNSNYDIVAGKKFELKYSGCDSGCDIYLMNGPAKNLKEVAKIATDVDGEASSVTIPENAPKDEYAFKIVPKEGKPNYSELFPVEGNGQEPEEESSSASSASASASSTSEEASTSTETETEAETTTTETSTSEEETSTETSVASSTSSSDATSTPSESATETDDDQPEETTSGSDDDEDDDAPDAASTLAASGVTFFAAAAALVAYIL